MKALILLPYEPGYLYYVHGVRGLGLGSLVLQLMVKILHHYLKDPKLWEFWYIPDDG